MNPACIQTEDLAWRLIDHDLSQNDVDALAAHVTSCGACRATMKQALRTDRLLQRAATMPPPTAAPSPTPHKGWLRWLLGGLGLLPVLIGVVWLQRASMPAEPPVSTAPMHATAVTATPVTTATAPSTITTTPAATAPTPTTSTTSSTPGLAFLAATGVLRNAHRQVLSWCDSTNGTLLVARPPADATGPIMTESIMGTGLCFRGHAELRAELPSEPSAGGMLLVVATGDGPKPHERMATLLDAQGQEVISLSWTTRGRRVSVMRHDHTAVAEMTLPPDEVVMACRWWPDGRLTLSAGSGPTRATITAQVGSVTPGTTLVIGGGAAGQPRFHGDIMACIWRPTAPDDAALDALIQDCGFGPLPVMTEPRL